ncbi:ester hydrolase C11orf54 homolog [Tetranychus urticae]|uniref:DUF1907 domain-containing protein n=1 Tax=Tetranychus urticae TaxID=32264 RepID=T1L1G0_TETUR|nr:ester hydrolase C11orf54 homolog [Tetranychus urticae]XP_025018070.1 ester hydrolase C11orf54 homolog [Tetranychus urticae]
MESKMSSVRSYEMKTCDLEPISLKELSTTLQDHLSKIYGHVKVSVVNCPDLSKEPFNLAGSYLGGKTAIADLGGIPYLVPVGYAAAPIYPLIHLAKKMGFQDAHLMGAACVPFQITGSIADFMPNISYSTDEQTGKTTVNHGSYYSEMVDDKKHIMRHLASDCVTVLANVFISENKPSKEIKIVASKRVDKRGESLTIAIRDILRIAYPEKAISMGGMFLARKGKINIHVMPNDFSKTPCDTEEKVNEWLKYFEASAPIVGLVTLHSKDPGFNFRDEHTHCIGKGEGGHYHHDTTPDTIEYEAYLNIAQKIVRIDQPALNNEIPR